MVADAARAGGHLLLITMSAAAPAIPVPGELARPRVRVIFGALMLVLLLAALDQTIVATALPTIVGDLGGLSHISWVTSAFLLAQTAVTPLYGKLGDLYGRKRILQTAVVLFLTWALVRIGEHGLSRARELASRDGVPAARITAVVAELRGNALIAGEDGAPRLTASGQLLAERAIAARRELLAEALADETADRDPAVNELLHRLAKELAGEPPTVAA
jgi:DNA-binding MarR family transcriptional regulator